MAEDPDEVSALASHIEGYLRERPHASDTVEGIRRWWLGSRWTDASESLITAALELRSPALGPGEADRPRPQQGDRGDLRRPRTDAELQALYEQLMAGQGGEAGLSPGEDGIVIAVSLGSVAVSADGEASGPAVEEGRRLLAGGQAGQVLVGEGTLSRLRELDLPAYPVCEVLPEAGETSETPERAYELLAGS